jgi:hypothetical protein
MFVRAVKRAWHRDLVSRPGTHAWVLSLYRAGEFHPQTVSDYFPIAAAESPSLKAAMERHCRDEQRHVKLYDRAVAALGEELVPFEGGDVFNVVIRSETNATFETATAKSADQRRERLAHFLAHAHFLELRISHSLDLHLEACASAGMPEIEALVQAVHHDEHRHTSYTLEAVRELLPKARAERVLDVHRRGEARANLKFSARQVRHFCSTFAHTAEVSHTLLYRACAAMMENAHAAL